MLQVGDQKKLNRPTRLYEGVFVFQGCTVEVLEITAGPDEIVVQFWDKEGQPQVLKGVKEEELI